MNVIKSVYNITDRLGVKYFEKYKYFGSMKYKIQILIPRMYSNTNTFKSIYKLLKYFCTLIVTQPPNSTQLCFNIVLIKFQVYGKNNCNIIMLYRTLRGRDQRKRCTLNFIKYTLSRPTVLHDHKECFIRSLRCNKVQLPTCLSAG